MEASRFRQPYREAQFVEASNRPRNIDLPQLSTIQDNPTYPKGGESNTFQVGSSASPQSAISLASPTLVAVRQYYKENGMFTAFQAGRSSRPSTVTTASSFPRRHSAMVSPANISNRLERVTVSSPLRTMSSRGGRSGSFPLRSASSRRDSLRRKSLMDESREMLLSGVTGCELQLLGTVVSRRKPIVHPKFETKASFQATAIHNQDRLRERGHAYLGNTLTADVFVKAVHMQAQDQVATSRLPDEVVLPSKEERPSDYNQDKIIVRARVFPSAKERKPFLIQRTFDLQELRSNISQAKRGSHQTENSDGGARMATTAPGVDSKPNTADLTIHMRSNSSLSPNPTESLSAIGCTEPHNFQAPKVTTNRSGMPIHVEYAIHFLPVLGALLLSGHIRKGDEIDLPIPNPEAWPAVISYIYTGKEEVSAAMKANIIYLAGHVD